MDFADVLKAMKNDGKRRFARTGWHGKRQYVYITPKTRVAPADWKGDVDITGDEAEFGVELSAHLDMYLDGRRIIGWCPTQSDMTEEDWVEVFA